MTEALLRNLLREWITEKYTVTEIDEFVDEFDSFGQPISHRDICRSRWESRLASMERVAPAWTNMHEKCRAVLTALSSIPPAERLYYWSAESAARKYSGVACASGIIVSYPNFASTPAQDAGPLPVPELESVQRPAKAMDLAILPQQVLLGGHDLLMHRESDRFLACFGQPSRKRDIPMNAQETRVAMVWDGLGLVAYEDRPERFMSHLYLAFHPASTPERPSQRSHSIIAINGGIVTAETTELTLPRNGPTPIAVSDGKHFFHEADLYRVAFLFERQSNPRGRELIVGRLECCSFLWR